MASALRPSAAQGLGRSRLLRKRLGSSWTQEPLRCQDATTQWRGGRERVVRYEGWRDQTRVQIAGDQQNVGCARRPRWVDTFGQTEKACFVSGLGACDAVHPRVCFECDAR